MRSLPTENRAARPPGLTIQGVSRRFGAVAALDDVSVDVAPGEFVSIIGPSGCGKSTLLRAIAGLERINAGEILIGGRDVRALRPSERGVALVFQSYALYPHMTCRENLAAPLAMRELSALGRAPLLHRLSPKARATRTAIAARVARTAAMLGLEPLLDRRPWQLSGGQRQRVALGRALIREPDVFLLDEPLANLDAALRNATRAELHALQRRVGAATLFVTHDQAEAMAVSDRIAVMFAGRVRQIGTPDELYREPADLEVARFLAQPWLNSLDAALVARQLERGGATARVRGTRLCAACGGVVAFRPEHATVHAAEDRAAAGPVPGLAVEVVRAEHAGPDANLFVRLLEDGTGCVVRIASGRIGEWRPGRRASMRFDPDAAWIFPRADPDDGLGDDGRPAAAVA